MAMGGLGRDFGRLGRVLGGASTPVTPPAFSPSLDFSDSRNSQYQPLVISMSDDPYEHVPPELMGGRRKKGQMP